MRNDCKKRPRPCPRSEKTPSSDLFHQTLTDYSQAETQSIFEFMKKVKQADDETGMFYRFCSEIQCYRSGCKPYTSLKNGCVSILRDNQGLVDEFLQLLSSFASPVIRNNEKKEKVQSDTERTIWFLTKIEALGASVYKAFISALPSSDIETLVEQLDDILLEDTSLKKEFVTFLVDSRLIKRKRKRKESVEVTPSYQIRPEAEESVEVTPSYQVRPEAEVGSSSDEVLNDKYYLDSPYDPEAASSSQKRSQRCLDTKRNNLEDKLMKEDILKHDLDAAILFGKYPSFFEEPPVGFNRVLEWIYGGKEVPREYKTHPKRAAVYLLPMLQYRHEKMKREKTSRVMNVYNRASRKGNVKT